MVINGSIVTAKIHLPKSNRSQSGFVFFSSGGIFVYLNNGVPSLLSGIPTADQSIPCPLSMGISSVLQRFFANTKTFLGGQLSFLWAHWHPCFGFLETPHLVFKDLGCRIMLLTYPKTNDSKCIPFENINTECQLWPVHTKPHPMGIG